MALSRVGRVNKHSHTICSLYVKIRSFTTIFQNVKYIIVSSSIKYFVDLTSCVDYHGRKPIS